MPTRMPNQSALTRAEEGKSRKERRLAPTALRLAFPTVFAILISVPHATFANIITDIVANISQSNLQQHVAQLAVERSSTAEKENAAAYISEELRSYGYSVGKDAANNVVATLAGMRFPQDYFIVGAHYDTVPNTPGADDNASGIAGMLEIARVFSTIREHVADSIEFVAFADEETGLLGSTYFAQTARAANENILGMISLEMIGYTSSDLKAIPDVPGCLDVSDSSLLPGNYVAGISTGSRMLIGLHDAAAQYVPNLELETGQVLDGSGRCFPDSRRSDHAPFWDQGYEAMMVTDMGDFRNHNYHQSSDTPSSLNFAFMTEVVQATTAYLGTETIPEPPVILLLATGIAALSPMVRRGARLS